MVFFPPGFALVTGGLQGQYSGCGKPTSGCEQLYAGFRCRSIRNWLHPSRVPTWTVRSPAH